MSKVVSKQSVKKVKEVKVKELSEPTPIPEPVVESVEPVVESVEPVVDETETMKYKFEKLIESKQNLLNTITTSIKKDIQDLRKMQKDHEHIVKDASKKQKRKKVVRDGPPRKPSGFNAPVLVSDEMYKFLESFGIAKGTPIERTTITKYITQYIKNNDLQNKDHRREIFPDTTLLKLFNNSPPLDVRNRKLPESPENPKVYGYLGMQKYLSTHFPKKQVVV